MKKKSRAVAGFAFHLDFADMEKPAGDFLSGADLGERAVFFGVEIDLQRFLAGI